MSFFRVALKFYPNQKNPARASGRGVWRVDGIWPDDAPRPVMIGMSGRLLVSAARQLKPKSRVDPLKLALARLQATT